MADAKTSAHELLATDGPRQPWIGANYWSRAGGPRMWSRYDPLVVREELATLAAHGCNVTRSFCYWPDFVPAPEQFDADVLQRFGDFLDAHVEARIGTIPTFVVGHMSGQNWDPPWRGDRDLYRDAWLVAQQAWLAGEIARRFGPHPAVVGWLVSNEMPLYGGPGTSEEIAAWARSIVDAVRAAGATQPISLGDGAWGVEVSGADNGYSLRTLAPLVDFVGPHVYPMEDDEVRQLLTAAFVCELASGFDRPVVLEEFGVSSDFASDEHAADYYRLVLHSTLLAGARGWIAWNNCDYDDLRNEDPYRHHVFEMHFGLTDRTGAPKPQLHEVARFAELVSELGAHGWERLAGEVALVVPEHFERELPFTEPAFRRDIRANLLQAYVAAREADLPVVASRERDGLPGNARLVIAPSTKLLTAPGLDRLRRLAEAGATVYLSYFAGSTANQRGPWLTWLDEIFGVRHTLRYGLVDPIEGDEVTFQFVEPLGEIEAGATLTFAVAGESSARAYLPVAPAGAEVVAIDGHGRPTLLRHALGSGSTILCTYPLEHMAARTPRVNPESTWRLYSALAAEAGVRRPVRVDDPRVITGLVRSGGAHTALFLNCSKDTIAADPILANGVLLPTAGTEPLLLAPFGVQAFPCEGVAASHAFEGTPALAAREGRDASM
ncbi:MAG TPA: cellulase family glycosylhydrolase [Gaiellaceae bacterium]|nr:cellulase family glycosylhydrolase [Gaiellaceae bacterium]